MNDTPESPTSSQSAELTCYANHNNLPINFRTLLAEARRRFEHITAINDTFTVYANHGHTCYTFSPEPHERYKIAVSLTNDEWCVETNITTGALFGDVQIFFNMIYDQCGLLDDEA